jgi:hypothetical protein
MSFNRVMIGTIWLATAVWCAGLGNSVLSAQELPPPKPKSGPARPAPVSPAVPKESPVPTEITPRASESSPPLTLAIGELTPVQPSPLPPERIEGERATPADMGRLVEWLAYLGAALYRASSPETSTIRELYKQLDAARDETGTFLTRAREGAGPPAQDYARLRSTLGGLHERIRSLGK